MLARIKMTYQEIKSAILGLDEQSLSIDNLKSLKQFTPTEEEVINISFLDSFQEQLIS